MSEDRFIKVPEMPLARLLDTVNELSVYVPADEWGMVRADLEELSALLLAPLGPDGTREPIR